MAKCMWTLDQNTKVLPQTVTTHIGCLCMLECFNFPSLKLRSTNMSQLDNAPV